MPPVLIRRVCWPGFNDFEVPRDECVAVQAGGLAGGVCFIPFGGNKEEGRRWGREDMGIRIAHTFTEYSTLSTQLYYNRYQHFSLSLTYSSQSRADDPAAPPACIIGQLSTPSPSSYAGSSFGMKLVHG